MHRTLYSLTKYNHKLNIMHVYSRKYNENCTVNSSCGVIYSESVMVKEHDDIFMHCDHGGRIHVTSARYGVVTCWGFYTGILQSRCDAKLYCLTPAENSIFSDPCPGDRKFFHADYTCGKLSSQVFNFN